MPEEGEIERPREVLLYVYDLSQGLARQFSQAFLGTYIDAVYHTSLVIAPNEFYYGYGLQVSTPPGTTHHGAPMNIISLGTTTLPDEVISEYLDSLRSIYTPEAYDLFMHNCNNFTNDFAMFLTGKGIPQYITSLPRTVLETPFGMMLKSQLEDALRPVVNAPVVGQSSGWGGATPLSSAAAPQPALVSPLRAITSSTELTRILTPNPAVVVWFTSPTCGPCHAISPYVSQLASTHSEKISFIKIDISVASDIAQQYNVTAVPTFMTFSHGEKLEEWKGADRAALDRNVELLVKIAYPPHPHTTLNLPLLFAVPMKPLTYPIPPPAEKVLAKLPSNIAQNPALRSMLEFIKHRKIDGAQETPLPDLSMWAEFLRSVLITTETSRPGYWEEHFPVIDIFRAVLIDARVSGWFVEEEERHSNLQGGKAKAAERSIISTLLHLLTTPEATSHSGTLTKSKDNNIEGGIPHPLHLTALQAICNLFTTPLFPPIPQPTQSTDTQSLVGLLIQAITTSLLQSTDHTRKSSVRSCAAQLTFNLSLVVQRLRSTQNRELLSQEELAELAVAVVEAIKQDPGEKSGYTGLKALVVALGLLMFCVLGEEEEGGGVLDVMDAIGAGEAVREMAEENRKTAGLCREVAGILEAK